MLWSKGGKKVFEETIRRATAFQHQHKITNVQQRFLYQKYMEKLVESSSAERTPQRDTQQMFSQGCDGVCRSTDPNKGRSLAIPSAHFLLRAILQRWGFDLSLPLQKPPSCPSVRDDKFLQRQQWFTQTGNKSPNQSGFFVQYIMPTESLASIILALRDRDNVHHRSFACAPEDVSTMGVQ